MTVAEARRRRGHATALACALAAAAGAARTAAAAPTTLSGDVLATAARWTATGDLVTDVTVRRDDGARVEVTQLGGTLDGIGQIVSHAPVRLRVGDVVALEVEGTWTRSAARRAPMVRRVLARRATLDGPDAPARYGVQRTSMSRVPLRWTESCIPIIIDGRGSGSLAGTRELDIVREAFAAWQVELDNCSGLDLYPRVEASADAGRDRRNVVTWHDDRWCRTGTDICYDPGTIAITRLTFIDNPDNDRDGEIIDADIELNGVDFALAEDGASTGPAGAPLMDLRATLTHEIGHFLTLDHNCDATGIDTPVDHVGRAVAACSAPDLSPEVLEATMYYQQSPGETKKATIESSDLLGACTAVADLVCSGEITSEVTCAASDSTPNGVAAGAATAGLLIALRRRRSSRVAPARG
jgi:hypothetical protein